MLQQRIDPLFAAACHLTGLSCRVQLLLRLLAGQACLGQVAGGVLDLLVKRLMFRQDVIHVAPGDLLADPGQRDLLVCQPGVFAALGMACFCLRKGSLASIPLYTRSAEALQGALLTTVAQLQQRQALFPLAAIGHDRLFMYLAWFGWKKLNCWRW